MRSSTSIDRHLGLNRRRGCRYTHDPLVLDNGFNVLAPLLHINTQSPRTRQQNCIERSPRRLETPPRAICIPSKCLKSLRSMPADPVSNMTNPARRPDVARNAQLLEDRLDTWMKCLARPPFRAA